MERAGRDKFQAKLFNHIGIVVRDVEKVAETWQRMFGIGPWVFIDRTRPDVWGQATGNKLAFGYLGDMEFELLQPVVQPVGNKYPNPTIWREFLDAHGEGLQHIAFGVDDVEAETAKLVAQGAKIKIAGNSWAYLDVAGAGIPFIELLKIHEPHLDQKA